jgi:hypothetical protein
MAPLDAIACLSSLLGVPECLISSTGARICQYRSFANFRPEDKIVSICCCKNGDVILCYECKDWIWTVALTGLCRLIHMGRSLE